MLHPTGTVLHNPMTAEWGRVMQADTDVHVAELITATGGGVTVLHRHPSQSEQFDVLAGELTVVLDGERHVFGPGATACVPAGVPHSWTSSGAEPLYARVSVRPTLDFQEVISAMWGLCALGRARRDGGPGALDGILMAEAFGENLELCSPPRWVQRAAVAAFAPLIRAAGRSITTREVLQAAVVDPQRWPGPGRPPGARLAPSPSVSSPASA